LKWIWLAGVLLQYAGNTCAQSTLAPAEMETFIRPAHNIIKNGEALDSLIRYIAQQPDPLFVLNVLHLGDSHIRANTFSRTFQFYLNAFFSHWAPKDRSRDGATRPVFVNLLEFAANGKRFADYTNNAELFQYLTDSRPQIIIVSLGTNDAYNRLTSQAVTEEITKLTDRILQAVPNTVLLFTSPPDATKPIAGKSPEAQLSIVRQAICDYTAGHGFAFWDLFMAMGGNQVMKKWQGLKMANYDGVHYLQTGYEVFGYAMALAVYERMKQAMSGE
jgi:lysophospholipase L1-like esterase